MFKIIRFAALGSTNQYALENSAALADRTVIVSNAQTGGRGRLRRPWLSPPDVNIYCSIVLKNLTDQPAMLTVLAALAALETIRKYNIPAQLKWPNDVLVNGRKICGILAETNARALVLGIGMNVNISAESLKELDRPATSMLAETGQIFDREKVLQELLENFFVFYERVLAEGFASLVKIWQNELQIIGKQVRVQTAQKDFGGTVSGIVDDGALIIETPQGTEKVLAGDVYVV